MLCRRQLHLRVRWLPIKSFMAKIFRTSLWTFPKSSKRRFNNKLKPRRFKTWPSSSKRPLMFCITTRSKLLYLLLASKIKELSLRSPKPRWSQTSRQSKLWWTRTRQQLRLSKPCRSNKKQRFRVRSRATPTRSLILTLILSSKLFTITTRRKSSRKLKLRSNNKFSNKRVSSPLQRANCQKKYRCWTIYSRFKRQTRQWLLNLSRWLMNPARPTLRSRRRSRMPMLLLKSSSRWMPTRKLLELPNSLSRKRRQLFWTKKRSSRTRRLSLSRTLPRLLMGS